MEIDDLGFTFRRRATQPSDQVLDKSQKMGHRTGSLRDSKGVARLDKIIGSDKGEKCDVEAACKLLDYVGEWEISSDALIGMRRGARSSIGTVNGISQPVVVVGSKVRNVPKEGYYAWDPGGYIELYQPSTSWIAP